LKHTIKGDANLVTVDEVNKLVEGDSSGRVAR
jgi:2-dehydro-3-deoxygluconokinase